MHNGPSKVIVSNQKEESISIQRVNEAYREAVIVSPLIIVTRNVHNWYKTTERTLYLTSSSSISYTVHILLLVRKKSPFLSILFVLFCCFTPQVNSFGHGGMVSSPNHTFSWASLNKQLTITSCTYFRL